jgi:8-oxo-dGTP diphosphatase
MNRLHKSGLIVIRDNRLLLVIKRNSPLLLMPGGRVEPGETAEQALIREVQEELACDLVADSIQFFAVFEDVAANEADTVVQIRAYTGQLQGEPRPSSEIEKLIWFGFEDDPNRLSPIIRNKVWPVLLEKYLILGGP